MSPGISFSAKDFAAAGLEVVFGAETDLVAVGFKADADFAAGLGEVTGFAAAAFGVVGLDAPGFTADLAAAGLTGDFDPAIALFGACLGGLTAFFEAAVVFEFADTGVTGFFTGDADLDAGFGEAAGF